MKRIAVCLFVLGLIFFLYPSGANLSAAEWFKGQLHCHTLWSDGDTLPELVLDWYRAEGFHFVSLTDHNVLQTDKNKWKATDQKLIQESRTKFGGDWAQTKEENGKTLVRLKPIDELREKFNEDGKFLVLPGHEQNATVAGRVLHANAINITETIPFPKNFSSVAEAMLSWRQATLDNASKSGNVGFWMVNHPDWPYFDVSPEMLIKAANVEFYEWNTTSVPRHSSIPPGHPAGTTLWHSVIHPDHPTFEKSWDVINAFRLHQGKKPIYVVATDDSHHYRNFGNNAVNPGHGWVVVRSEKLEADALVAAMKNGDFYSSTGIEMKDIRFDSETKTLYVEVRPEDDIFYSIRFVGTKKDFDTSTRTFDDPAIGSFKPLRVGTAYSGDIGITFHTVTGTSASYQVSPDDLYVRAVITSTKPHKYQERNKPLTETAWTQPYGW